MDVSVSGSVKIGPMCICIKDHGRNVCERLQQLRLSTGLVDLDILVEEERLRVHKVVLAAASKFFRDQLTKANVLVPVILRLEDFGLELKREAVSYIVEFIYCGEVLIPGECLSDVCVAAHTLGIYGLIEFLPNAVAPGKDPNQLLLASPASSSSLPLPSQPQALPQPPQPSESYLEPSFSSVDPVLDDALSLLSSREPEAVPPPPHGKLRVFSDPSPTPSSLPPPPTPHPASSSSKDPRNNISTPEPPENWSDNWTAPWSEDCVERNIKQGSWTTPALPSSSIQEPILLWNHPSPDRRKKPSSTNNNTNTNSNSNMTTTTTTNWKGDLEVRKDLTLPSAPSDGGDNVFQEEDPSIPNYPIVHLDDGDLEIHEEEEEGSSRPSDQPPGDDVEEVPFPSSSGDSPSSSSSQQQPPNGSSSSSSSAPIHNNSLPLGESCPVCQISGLVGKEAVNIHVYKEHGMGELFRCEECSYETSFKATYVDHVAQHAEAPGKDKMKCSKCIKEFKSKIGLKLHLKQHYNDQLNLCLFCDFKTPLKINLTKHMASKHKKSIDGKDLASDFKCQFCPFECVADHQLKSHLLRKHTAKEEMKFRCVSCSYASVERAALEKHVRFKHTKERPFMCGICGFSTHTLSSMARHKRAHLKSKPHSCKMCGASYADKKRLSEHMLSHSGEKPFACNSCSYKCRRKDNLGAHVRRVHGKSMPPKANPNNSTPSNNNNTNRESHIIGHVNQDGSIGPVVANPKPLNPNIDT